MVNNQIKFGIGFNVDKSGLNEALKSLQDIQKLTLKDTKKLGLDVDFTALQNARSAAASLQNSLKAAYNVKFNTIDVKKFQENIQKSGQSVQSLYKELSSLGSVGKNAFLEMEKSVLNSSVQLQKQKTVIDKMAETLTNTLKWNLASGAIHKMTGTIQQAYGYVKNLDTALNHIQIVTGQSSEQMAQFAIEANKAAKALGNTTNDYTRAALTFYQQGLDDKEVKARTQLTMKVANVSGLNTDTSAEYITSVLNGYKVAAQDAESAMDILANVGAHTASSLSELAEGMSKVASAANTMGVSEEQLAATLATVISATRQDASQVGTAFKTVYARISDIQAGTEDAEISLGNYTEKMAQMGYNVLDSTGNLRDLGEVIEEIGYGWKDMTREQQVSLAQTMAGTRQYNNLMALFDNWDQYVKTMNVASNSVGTLQEQEDTYLESTQAHLNALSAQWEDLFDSLVKPDDINNVTDSVKEVISFITNLVDSLGGGIGVLKNLGSIAMMVFSKQIGTGLVNTLTQTNDLNQAIAQTENKMNMINAAKSADNAKQYEEMQQSLADSVQLELEHAQSLTKEERERLKIARERIIDLQEEINKQQDIITNTEKARTEAQKDYNDRKQEIKVDYQDAITEAKDQYRQREIEAISRRDSRANTYSNITSMARTFTRINSNIDDNYFQSTGDKTFQAILKNINQNGRLDALINASSSNMDAAKNAALALTSTGGNTKDNRLAVQRELDLLKNNGDFSKALQNVDANLYNEIQKAVQKANFSSTAPGGNINNKSYSSIVHALDLIEQGKGKVKTAAVDTKNFLSQEQKDVKTAATEFAEAIKDAKDLFKDEVKNARSARKEQEQVADDTYQQQEDDNKTVIDNATAVTAAAEEGQKAIDKEQEAIKKIVAQRESMQSVNMVIGGTLSTIMSIQNLGALPNIWENQNLSTGQKTLQTAQSLLISLPMLASGISSVLTNITKIGPAIGLMDEKIIGLFTSSAFLPIMAVATAIGAITYAITKYNAAQHKAEAEAEKASKTLDQLTNAYTDTKNSVEELKNSVNNWQNAKSVISELKQGTSEWKDAIKSANEQAQGLIDKYNLLGKWHYDKDTGLISIEQDALDELEAQQEQAMNAAYQNVAFAKIYASTTEAQAKKENLLNSAVAGRSNIGGYDSIFSLQEFGDEKLESIINKLETEFGERFDLKEQDVLKAYLEKDSGLDLDQAQYDAIVKNIDVLKKYSDVIKQATADQKEYNNEFVSSLMKEGNNKSILNSLSKQTGINEDAIAKILAKSREDEIQNKLESNRNEIDAFNISTERELSQYLVDNKLITQEKADTGFHRSDVMRYYAKYALGKSDDELSSYYMSKEGDLVNRLGEVIVEKESDINSLIQAIAQGLARDEILKTIKLDEITDAEQDALLNLVEKSGGIDKQFGTNFTDAFIAEMQKGEADGQLDITGMFKALSPEEVQELLGTDDLANYFGFDKESLKMLGAENADAFSDGFKEQLQKYDPITYWIAVRDKKATEAQSYAELATTAVSGKFDKDQQEAYDKLIEDNPALKDINPFSKEGLDAMRQSAREANKIANDTAAKIANENALKQKLANIPISLDPNAKKYLEKQINETVEDINPTIEATIAFGMADQTDAIADLITNDYKIDDKTIDSLVNSGNAELLGQMSVNELTGELELSKEIVDAYYDNLRLANEEEIARLEAEIKKWEKELATVTEGSKEWLDLTDKLGTNYAAIAELRQSEVKVNLKKSNEEEDKKNKLYEAELTLLKLQNKELDRKMSLLKQEQSKVKGVIGERTALDAEISLMEQQKAKYAELKAKAEEYASFQAQLLRDLLKSLGIANGLSIDEQTGIIKNYFDLYKQIYDEQGPDAAEKFKHMADLYHTYVDEAAEYGMNIANKEFEQLQARIDKFKIKLQIEIDKDKIEADLNELMSEFIKDDDYISIAQNALSNASIYNPNSSTYGALAEQLAEANKVANYDFSGVFGDNAAAALEAMQSGFSTASEYAKKLLADAEKIQKAFEDSIEAVAKAYKDQSEVYELYDKQLEYDIQLIGILYGDKAYDKLQKYYDKQVQISEQQVKNSQDQVDYWEKLMKAALEAGDIDTYNIYYEHWKEALEELNSDIETWAERLTQDYQNTISGIFDSLEMELTDGLGLDDMSAQLDAMLDDTNSYLDAINAAYGVQKLSLNMQDAVNNATGAGQKKLNAAMAEQLKYLNEKENLSQYDLDIAEKEFEIAKARVAWEEAQNNKTTLKLQRNSQGNYVYRYVANKGDVDKAYQKLLDLQNSLYNFDKDAYNKNLKELASLQEEYYKKLNELANNTTLSDEERAEKRKQIEENYLGRIEFLTEQNADIRKNLEKSAATEIQQYFKNTGDTFETMVGKSGGSKGIVPTWESGVQAMIDKANKLGGFQTIVETAWTKVISAANDYKNKLEEVKRASEKVDLSVNSNWNAVKDQADAALKKAQGYASELDNLRNKIPLLVDQATKWGQIATQITDSLLRLKDFDALRISDKTYTVTEVHKTEYDEGYKAEIKVGGAGHGGPAALIGSNFQNGSSVGGVKFDANSYSPYMSSDGNDVVFTKSFSSEAQARAWYDELEKYLKAGHLQYTPGNKAITKLATGGYTGEWGDEGKLAYLHEKELVLNQEDTRNILSAVDMVRDISKYISDSALNAKNNLMSRLSTVVPSFSTNTDSHNQTIEQQVSITANFEGQTSADQITTALDNLMNIASQRANRNLR